MIEATATMLSLSGFALRMAGRRRLMWFSLWLSLPANVAAVIVLGAGDHWWFVVERVVFLAGAAYGLYAWSGSERTPRTAP